MTDNAQPTNETTPAPAGATDTGAGSKPGTPANATAKTFTQEEVNLFMQTRVNETKASFLGDVLKELGVNSLEDAKAATTALKKIQDDQLTAQQKLERDMATATEARQKAESAVQTTRIENSALKSFKNQVATDRYDAALKLLDTSKLSVDANGAVQGMAEAVTALLEAYPFLRPSDPAPAVPGGKPKAPPIGATNPAGTGNQSDVSNWHPLVRNADKRIGGGGYTTSKE